MPLFFRLIVSTIRASIRNFARIPASVTICWRIGSMTGIVDACCVRSSMLERVDGCTLEALPSFVSLRVLRRSGMLPHPAVTGALGAE